MFGGFFNAIKDNKAISLMVCEALRYEPLSEQGRLINKKVVEHAGLRDMRKALSSRYSRQVIQAMGALVFLETMLREFAEHDLVLARNNMFWGVVRLRPAIAQHFGYDEFDLDFNFNIFSEVWEHQGEILDEFNFISEEAERV